MELENKLDLLANQFRHAKNFYVSTKLLYTFIIVHMFKADISMNKEITSLKLKRDGIEHEGKLNHKIAS